MRSVSNCGQTITPSSVVIKRSYTNSTEREIMSWTLKLSPFSLPFSLQMKSLRKGLSFIWVLSSLPPVQLRSTTETRQTSLLCLLFYMGGTIIPGIAACGKRGGGQRAGEGEWWRWGIKKEWKRSVMWLLGFICHHNSHITEKKCSSIWWTKTTLPHYLFIPRPQNQNIFLCGDAKLAGDDNIVQLFTRFLNMLHEQAAIANC